MILDKATGVRTTVKTNPSGFYSIGNLPIGQYSMTVSHPGFRSSVRESIELGTGEVLGLDVKLDVGAVSDQVTITAASPIVQSQTSDVSQTIGAESVEDLPLGDRETLNIIKMVGGAVFASYGANATSNPNFSLAGGRSRSQMFWIDGGSAQNMRLGAPTVDEDPPVETMEEIKVLSNNNAAEYGGSAAGTVIMTTKSGTNAFHGALYEYLRNSAFDAPGFFAPVANGEKIAPELRYNVFGGALGGRIRRDKTFFFVGLDNSLRRQGSTAVLTVPTALQDAGNFSQTLNSKGQVIPIYDPHSTAGSGTSATRTVFPGNIIPASELDPVGVALMKFYPLPDQAASNLAGANNFSGNYVVGTTHYNVTVKIDHTFGVNDRLTGRFLYNYDNNNDTSVYPTPAADPTGYAEDWQQFYYADWTHTVTPSQINDFRFTFENRLNHSLTFGIGGDWPSKLGITGLDSNNAFPNVAPAGYSALGSTSQERQQFPIRSYQWVDNYSWVRGKHTMKFGAELRKSFNTDINLNEASGSFAFAATGTGLPGNTATGVGLASLMTGFVTGFSEALTLPLVRTSWYMAGFAQDDWAVNSRLTINAGLRWELDTPMIDVNNRMNGFDLNAINPVSGTPGVVTFLGKNGLSNKPYDTDGNNFGPRFGFAWKPIGNTTVVRGGYGVFFAHPFDASETTNAASGYNQSATLNTPDNGVTPSFYLHTGVPGGIAPSSPTLDDTFGAVKVGQNATTSVNFFDTHRATGYSQQFNLGIQHQLPGSVLIEVSGIGNLSRKLPSTALSLDQIAPQLLGPTCDTQSCRPFPQFSGVSILAPTLGVSNYYAGMVRAEKRFSKGLSFLATYTYSKFLANTVDAGSVLGNEGGSYSNYYNRAADYGPDGNDIRSRFAFSEVYQLPFGTGQRWLASNPLRFVVGGWSVGSIVNLQTGPPFTVTTQTNNTDAFSAGNQRANVISNPNISARSVSEWFNTAAFAQPAIFQFGNQGVGIVRGPGVISVDASLLRDFQVTERFRLQIRGEFLNATNHTNLGLPGSSLGTSGFGVISSAGLAREVQLGARLRF
jgi:hypothetical protein